jgi:hypothetical protein
MSGGSAANGAKGPKTGILLERSGRGKEGETDGEKDLLTQKHLQHQPASKA